VDKDIQKLIADAQKVIATFKGTSFDMTDAKAEVKTAEEVKEYKHPPVEVEAKQGEELPVFDTEEDEEVDISYEGVQLEEDEETDPIDVEFEKEGEKEVETKEEGIDPSVMTVREYAEKTGYISIIVPSDKLFKHVPEPLHDISMADFGEAMVDTFVEYFENIKNGSNKPKTD